jgi:hypothetical protein
VPVLVRLRVSLLDWNRFLVNLFRRCVGRRCRERFRPQFLVHRAAAMVPIADDLRIVRGADGRAEIAVDVLAGAVVAAADADAAVAEASLAGIALGVLGANFPLRSMHRHDRLRIMRANRARRKDTSRRCCLASLSLSSRREGRRIFRHRLCRRTPMMLKRRRAIGLLSSRMNLRHLNQRRTGTCRKM